MVGDNEDLAPELGLGFTAFEKQLCLSRLMTGVGFRVENLFALVLSRRPQPPFKVRLSNARSLACWAMEAAP